MAHAFARSAEVVVPAGPAAVLAILDDARRLGHGMEKPSAMMLGGCIATSSTTGTGTPWGP